jgi:hypothetical protein
MESKLSVNTSRRGVPRRKWGREVFAEIEQVGSIQLNQERRRHLRALIEGYEQNCCSWMEKNSSDSRERLDDLIKTLDETVRKIEATSDVAFMAFHQAHIDAEIDKGRGTAWLKSLHRHCVDIRRQQWQRGRRPNPYLHELLGGLAIYFVDWGGTWKKVRRDGLSVSPFIRFAWAILSQVPPSMRPSSMDALAKAFQRLELEPLMMSITSSCARQVIADAL